MSEQSAVTAVVEARSGRGTATRVLALDGLRAVAVLAVMAFHTGSSPLQGGFLGVDIFFVLSGFLITAILLRSPDRVHVGTFWLRRARRLAPALLLLLLVLAVQRALAPGSAGSATTGQLLAALSYTTNWFQIATGDDYFSQFASISPLLHTWSLAIEEQFYIVFALLLAWLLPRGVTRSGLRTVLVVLASFSAVCMLVAAVVGAQTWAYYSTLTRVQALLIGALLTVWMVRHPQRWESARTGSGIAAAVALAAIMVLAPESLFYGGYLAVALLSAVLIWAVAGDGPLSRALGWRPMVALGTISYGVYLWHWPVFAWLGTTDQDAALHTQLWAFIVTVLLAAISYVAVERPIRRGRFTALPQRRQWLIYAGSAAALAILAVLPTRAESTPAPATPWPAAESLPTGISTSGDSTVLVLNLGFPHDVYPQVALAGVTKMGCGLMTLPRWRSGAAEQTPEDCLRWREEWQAFGRDSSAGAVVIGSPVWDSLDRVIDGQRVAPGTPGFDEAYTAAVRDAVEVASEGGSVPVYMLGIPCFNALVDGDILNDPQRRSRINALTEAALADLPAGHYVDLTALTCDQGDSVSPARAREVYKDGLHWSPQGAREVWSQVLTAISLDGAGPSAAH